MHFLSPLWLFAVAAVSIPVIIHLWNIRPGKTLKVGSISLIEASSRKRSRSFKLLDLLLLLLRCLFLVILAFVLAMPYLKKQPDVTKSKGWLLIPKESFKETYQKFKSTAGPLLKSGYELHYFDGSFPKTDLQQALSDTSKLNSNNAASYWNLIKQLDQQVPAGLDVYLFTTNTLSHFNGSKPEVALKLNWQTYTPADSNRTWIKTAWFTANKDVHVVQGTSKPSGTFYSAQNVSSGAEASSPFNIAVNGGQATISLKSGNQKPVVVDTASLKVEVYAGENSLDAGYVKAALESIGQFTQRNITVKPYTNNANAVVKKDWLFWLSDKTLNPNEASRFKNVLVYKPGKAAAVNSWISNSDTYSVTQGQPIIPLYKLITQKNDKGEPVWHDGFGNPILTRDAANGTATYHFYSRFNPGWSDLVWDDNFPKLILQLMVGNEPAGTEEDYRIADNKAIQPIIVKEAGITAGTHSIDNDVTRYFWLVLALVFLVERWLVYRTATDKRVELN